MHMVTVIILLLGAAVYRPVVLCRDARRVRALHAEVINYGH
jgi:hypothetical protein